MQYKQNRLKTILSRARYFFALLKTRLFKKRIPVICILVINNKCNFNCPYCFGDYASREIKDYSTEELKRLIDGLYKMGTRYLTVHGGETLLRRDIKEIIDYIKGKGMYCCLITNGALLPQKIDEVKNVDNLTISLDGTKEHNDLNRGEGTFEKALNAIKLARKNRIPLRVSATITKYTMNDIGYLAQLAKDLGFTVHFSILFKPLPQAGDFEMTNEEIKSATNQIIEYKKKGFPIFTSCRAAEYARDWPLDHRDYHFLKRSEMHKLPRHFKLIKCYYSKIKITIEADGNVYPCFLRVDDFKALNWREVGLEKAIRHVQENTDCVTCPTLTHNDHNLLMDLNLKQIFNLIFEQFKESFRRS